MVKTALVLLATIFFGCSSSSVDLTENKALVPGGSALFLIGGQSNARGVEGFVSSDSLVALEASGEYSAWPTFALECSTRLNYPVTIVNTRVGGSSQTYQSDQSRTEGYRHGSWDERGELWARSVSMTDSALANNPGAQLVGIVWVQGEADAGAIDRGAIELAHYQRALERMIVRYRVKYGPISFSIVRTGRLASGDTPGFQAVRIAQDRVGAADSLDAPVAYAKTINFPGWGLMEDNIHYSRDGLKAVGRDVARFLCAQGGE